MWGLFVVIYMVKLARYGTPVPQPLNVMNNVKAKRYEGASGR